MFALKSNDADYDNCFNELSNDLRLWKSKEILLNKQNMERLKILLFVSPLNFPNEGKLQDFLVKVFGTDSNPTTLTTRFLNLLNFIQVKYSNAFLSKLKKKILNSFGNGYGNGFFSYSKKEWKSIFKKYPFLWLIIIIQFAIAYDKNDDTFKALI